jgi:hypothetical protein
LVNQASFSSAIDESEYQGPVFLFQIIIDLVKIKHSPCKCLEKLGTITWQWLPVTMPKRIGTSG